MRWMNLEPITQSKISQKEKNKYRMLTHTQNLAQLVKNLPAMQETQLPFLGLEDSLEEEMATYSRILAWRIHGQRSLAGYSPWGHKVLATTE